MQPPERDRSARAVLARRAALPLRVTLVGLLLGFVVVAGREVAATVGIGTGGAGDSYDLFAVSLTGVVGGVFALGSTARAGATPGRFATAFSLVYATAGAVALVVCLVRLGASTPLLRSLAAAFLGTAIAAASAFFGLATPDDQAQDQAPRSPPRST